MRKSQQNNTLFNYFNKSNDNNSKQQNNSPKSSKPEDKASNGSVAKSGGASTSKAVESGPAIPYGLHDLVWAKLEGFPWWPSIVCPHPQSNEYMKRKGKAVQIHVQFFDDPVSRAWIRLRDLKPYLGKHKSDVPLLKDLKWNQSIEFADQALKMERDERWTLIADLLPSDDDDIQLVDNDVDMESTNRSMNKSSSVENESPKEKSNKKEQKLEQKSDLKRKASNGGKERSDRKKFKKLVLSSEDGSDESDEEFKVSSAEESSDEEDIKEIVDSDVSSVEEIDTSDIDSEPKPKRSHSSKSKNKSKDKSKKSKSNKRKVSKKSIKKRSESEETSCSEDSFASSESEPKPKKTNVSKPSVSSKNWLNQRSAEKKKSIESKTSNTPKRSAGNNSKLNTSVVLLGNESFRPEFGEEKGDKEWPHFNYEFLKPEKLKDKAGRYRLMKGELNPDYDCTTLSIPESFLNSCTPAQRQWWVFKSNAFDTILFFKMGKFYELFHTDAVIAVNELQIAYMKSELCHAGFPEKAYKRYADVLIQKGYKVARIEQTETPAMMEERCRQMKGKASKFDKVVNREVCRISTIGTRMASVIDSDMLTDRSSYLLAITEKSSETGSEFGICFIDVSIGKFHLSQFSDDRHSSRLRTLIAHNPPTELVFDSKNLSLNTKQLIENCSPNARKETKKEFWTSKKTLKYLTEGDFFGKELPPVLSHMLDETDSLKQTARPEYELAIRSLGAVIQFCIECLISDEILSMKMFVEYKPLDTSSEEESSVRLPNNMIVDCFSLRNLEIFENSLGGTEGTLNEVLDFCSTPFGRRLLKKWICSPLCDIEQIESRQSAITDLSNVCNRYEIEETIKEFRKLPDLERLLTKIHSQGSAKRAKSHPDSRAIMFEMDFYNRRKISDFLSVLDGFKQSMKIIESLRKQSFNSSLLSKCLQRFPDLNGKLRFFDEAFDHKKAKNEGKVLPQTGTDPEFDELNSSIDSIKAKFDKYLDEQKKFFGCKVTYFGTAKNRYQLEVPESASKRISKDNKDYELSSSRKGFRRYTTPYIKKLFDQLVVKEEAKECVLQDGMRRIFEAFDNHYHKWMEAIDCLSLLDVLLSLTKSRSFLQQNNKSVVCLPKFSHPSADVKPFVNLMDSSNPCLLKYCQNLIPNDIRIESELLLLTGPNMGGKSTLMRQLGLIVVMAQIGAYVPAKECSLTPVDRVFTRLGAFDRIIEGESTFFVELSETALILRDATKHSLVLIDELGRGTSTFDGTAIACAVTKELSESIKCRTLFSSHYHSLVDEFKDNPSVKLVHMACMIENENESDPTQENITFLYKLKDNSCPKSYGFNAAKLAGIPEDVVRNAFKKAKQFERQNGIEKMLRKVAENNANDNQIMSIIPHLKSLIIDHKV